MDLDIDGKIAVAGVFQRSRARVETGAGQHEHSGERAGPFGFGEPGVDAPAVRPAEADLPAFDFLGHVPLRIVILRQRCVGEVVRADFGGIKRLEGRLVAGVERDFRQRELGLVPERAEICRA